MSIHFLQLTGRGHCFICHKTFEKDIDKHWSEHYETTDVATACDDVCREDYPPLVGDVRM